MKPLNEPTDWVYIPQIIIAYRFSLTASCILSSKGSPLSFPYSPGSVLSYPQRHRACSCAFSPTPGTSCSTRRLVLAPLTARKARSRSNRLLLSFQRGLVGLFLLTSISAAMMALRARVNRPLSSLQVVIQGMGGTKRQIGRFGSSRLWIWLRMLARLVRKSLFPDGKGYLWVGNDV